MPQSKRRSHQRRQSLMMPPGATLAITHSELLRRKRMVPSPCHHPLQVSPHACKRLREPPKPRFEICQTCAHLARVFRDVTHLMWGTVVCRWSGSACFDHRCQGKDGHVNVLCQRWWLRRSQGSSLLRCSNVDENRYDLNEGRVDVSSAAMIRCHQSQKFKLQVRNYGS